MKVLIIEDDPTARLMLKSMLDKFGEVTESRTGGEGMQSFYSALSANSPYDLVCLDIGLPEMDGLDLLRFIRNVEGEKHGKRSVVIVISARNDSEAVENMLGLGADGYLVKPINRAQLLGQLNALGLRLNSPAEPPQKAPGSSDPEVSQPPV
jgi:two-component system chemotaxis response regulator CheY